MALEIHTVKIQRDASFATVGRFLVGKFLAHSSDFFFDLSSQILE